MQTGPKKKKALDSLQKNSKLVWDWHQSLLKVAELNRSHLVCVSEQKGTDGNEIADQLARQGSSQTFIGHGPGLSITAEVARGVLDK
jgi:ribonuclease HI